MAELTTEAVREEVTAWLAANFDPNMTVEAWWALLAASGYAAPMFPETHFGKGYNRALANVVSEEIVAIGAIGAPSGLGFALAAPTIVAHGNEAQKEWLSRILTGQDAWCQLFSEPGAG